MDALVELGIARSEARDGVTERLARADIEGLNAHVVALQAYARSNTETVLATLLFEQFRRQNLISWNLTALPGTSGKMVAFNNFPFSATGFSYLKPMLRFHKTDKPKPAPVVMDVLAKPCARFDVEAFIERIVRAGQNKNQKLSFFGILAAFDFEKPAWQLAKSEGLMLINLRQHFGTDAFEALLQIQELLKNVAGEPAQANDAAYKKIADSLADLKANPYVVDLRSLGFESVSGLIVRTMGYENVNLNLKVMRESGEEREVDVSGERNGGQELVIVECKAEADQKTLNPEYVRKFFTETVPAFLRSRPGGNVRQCRAEIWTTGQVGPDAVAALKELKLKTVVKAALLGRNDVIPTTLIE